MAQWTGEPAYKQVAEDLRASIKDGRTRSAPAALDRRLDAQVRGVHHRHPDGAQRTAQRRAARQPPGQGQLRPRQAVGETADPAAIAEFEAIMRHLDQVHDDVRRLDDRLDQLEALVRGKDSRPASELVDPRPDPPTSRSTAASSAATCLRSDSDSDIGASGSVPQPPSASDRATGRWSLRTPVASGQRPQRSNKCWLCAAAVVHSRGVERPISQGPASGWCERMEIRQVDPDRPEEFRAWFDAGDAGQSAGRIDPYETSYAEWVHAVGAASSAERFEAVGVFRDGACVGAAAIILPLLDNTQLAIFLVLVPPSQRRRGVGGALVEHLGSLARAEGRRTWYAQVRLPAGAEETADTRFATRYGSRCAIPRYGGSRGCRCPRSRWPSWRHTPPNEPTATASCPGRVRARRSMSSSTHTCVG